LRQSRNDGPLRLCEAGALAADGPSARLLGRTRTDGKRSIETSVPEGDCAERSLWLDGHRDYSRAGDGQQISRRGKQATLESDIEYLGAGPSFIFSTASNWRLGQNKWQLGPAGVLGYLGGKWIAGVFPQLWFSVGGPGSQTVSQMNIQYFFQYFPDSGWGIGTSPNMLVNWYANKSGNEITFPIGMQISKVVKIGPLPAKLAVQGQ
jgi:hypothetical protein